MKKLALCLALMCAFTHTYAGAKEEVIRFGMDSSYPPFSSKGPDGKLHGFDIDLGEAICAKLKARCQWVEQDFDSLIIALKARKFDAILASMSATEQRKKQIDFSDMLYNTPTRLIAPARAALEPLPQALKGKRIGVQQGSVQEMYAKHYWAAAGAKIISYPSQEMVYADLRAGRLDASLQDQVQAALGFLKTPRGKGFRFASPHLNDPGILGQGSAIGIPKGKTAFQARLNQAIAQIRQDGTFQSLAKKYFDFDIEGN